MQGYWKITTLDGQRFEIPDNYYGDQCAVDLMKKNGCFEVRYIGEQTAETVVLGGPDDGR